MRAIVTDGKENVWEEQRPRPSPSNGEVLIKIRAVGICGSDIGLIHGEGPPWTNYPLVPGHEVCAEVVELGDDVDSLSVGDRVALHGFIYCSTCTACREGRYYQCDDLKEIGFTLDGGYREYATVPAYTLNPVPESLSDSEVTQVDSAACTLHALQRVQTSFTDTAAVLGPGSLGLFGVQLLAAQGVENIILTGTRDERLTVGETYGANLTVNVRETDPVTRIKEYTNGAGVDICVEAAGGGDVLNTCLEVATQQGDVVLTGVFDDRKAIDPNDIVAKELTVIGGVTAAHATDQVMELFQRGDLSVDGIVTHEFSLEEYERALETVLNREDGVIKAILRP
ncbi:zinc-dependent alcohol dehydrogenase [Halorussus salinus]|uniref:zinc-dependent alcohol dehydrogenase n=1 Tax=Halorussus salinus TaxID=1364935 RepID=UPI0010926CC5|nr:alcohol dehydrogenase catalytic domain-containing protein [Halorussus salinus]